MEALYVINNLKEPISQFGHVLRETAIRYGDPKEGNAKRLYVIPLTPHIQGFGQPHVHQEYSRTATSTIELDGLRWYCWQLDGTDKEKLKQFSDDYKHILRALLEGDLELFLWSFDTITGEKEYVGSFGIISGALTPDRLVFTTSEHFRKFTSISSYDKTFHNDISAVMRMFLRYSLPLVPKTRGSEIHYNFIF